MSQHLKKFYYINLLSFIHIYETKKHVIIDMLGTYHIFQASHNQSQAQGSSKAQGSAQ